jgi:hypothetical protein
MATLEELERRVAALEQEVAQLRKEEEHRVASETGAERAARALRESKRSHARMVAAWNAALKEMGIEGEPVGAKKLQEMMLAAGINPEDNEFSRGIIEMREE